jgi:hypothetical protein
MRTCNFLLRSLGVFSCLLGPVIAVYGVEVSGLSIKQNVQGATLVHPDSPVVRLDELLGKYPFLEAHIDEKVEILFSGEDSSSQGSDSELTDGGALHLIPHQIRTIQNGPTFCRKKMGSARTRLLSP